jgi:hypothetical protein
MAPHLSRLGKLIGAISAPFAAVKLNRARRACFPIQRNNPNTLQMCGVGGNQHTEQAQLEIDGDIQKESARDAARTRPSI